MQQTEYIGMCVPAFMQPNLTGANLTGWFFPTTD